MDVRRSEVAPRSESDRQHQRRTSQTRRAAFSSCVLVSALVAGGCAAKREARVRRNWNDNDNPAVAGEDSRTPNEDGTSEAPPPTPPKQGWARVEELVERTNGVMMTNPSPSVLAELAAQWCEVEPIPRETDHGETRVCYLFPAVRVEGVALTLELGEGGIVGFVAPDVDDGTSRMISERARRELQHLCTHAWAIAVAGLDIRTCTVTGGSTLSVARLRTQPEDDRWQVSVAVLGAI